MNIVNPAGGHIHQSPVIPHGVADCAVPLSVRGSALRFADRKRLRGGPAAPATIALRHVLAGACVAAALTACASSRMDAATTVSVDARASAAVDPLDATFTIEGEPTDLVAGRAARQAAPGSATRVTTAVFDAPARGDLDGDGTEDAALILVQQPGGSGTFYYVAAALAVEGLFRGSNAVLLGDRIAPQSLAVRNGVIRASYADRRAGEPMAAAPSVGRTMYLTLRDGMLVEIGPMAAGEQIVEGWVVIGHEVRSFDPCSDPRGHWLSGVSPALQAIMSAYRAALPDAPPYTPLFMTLAGRFDAGTNDGFGARYDAGFTATQLVRVWPRGNC
jgi:hypothetical protein